MAQFPRLSPHEQLLKEARRFGGNGEPNMIQRVNQMGNWGKNPKPEILAAPSLGPVGVGGTGRLCHYGYQVLLGDPRGYSPYRQGECLRIDINQYSFSFIDKDAEDRMKGLPGHLGSQRHSGCLAGLCCRRAP